MPDRAVSLRSLFAWRPPLRLGAECGCIANATKGGDPAIRQPRYVRAMSEAHDPGPAAQSVQSNSGSPVGSVRGGSYRLTRLIGQGGMGAVYEGVQLRLERRVAVKLMARELSANPEAIAR